MEGVGRGRVDLDEVEERCLALSDCFGVEEVHHEIAVLDANHDVYRVRWCVECRDGAGVSRVGVRVQSESDVKFGSVAPEQLRSQTTCKLESSTTTASFILLHSFLFSTLCANSRKTAQPYEPTAKKKPRPCSTLR